MTSPRDEVLQRVSATFDRDSRERVVALLDTYGVAAYERERERVQLAIVGLSEGSEERLREFVAVAKRDYRDVLFWAEYPDEAKLDTPEKWQRLRAMMEKFGVKETNGLRRACVEYRTYLDRARQSVDDEIRNYPTPIPRCDAQFNHLYDRRARLSQAVARANVALDVPVPAPALAETFATLVAEASCTESVEEDRLRDELRSELQRLDP